MSERLTELSERHRKKHPHRMNFCDICTALAGLDALAADLAATKKLILDALDVLDEKEAPTESGGVDLSLVGRVRALWSKLVIEGNQRAGKIIDRAEAAEADLAAAQQALREAREALLNDGMIADFHTDHPEQVAEDCIVCTIDSALALVVEGEPDA